MITKKQKNVLDFIKNFQQKNAISPSLEEIKKKFGLASVSTASYYVEKLESKGYLKKDDKQHRGISVFENESMVKIPLLGVIAAGEPIQSIENREEIALPKSRIGNNNNVFALRVSGDSMIDENIQDGDVVVVRETKNPTNGDKVVALIDRENVTLKTFYKEKKQILLKPANKKYDSIVIDKNREFEIQGVMIDIVKQSFNNPVDIIFPEKAQKRKTTIPLNKVVCGDCVDVMKNIPDNSVDMVVTSPPYDDVRNYNGFSFNLHDTGKEIFRILKDGGVVAMVIQDQTKNFGKSLTSFRTIVDWVDNIGFKLFETVIYRKHGTEGAWWKYRFRVDHEYMPIFIKGERPSYFNKENLKIPSKHGGKVMTGSGNRKTDGTTTKTVTRPINLNKCRGTIWDYLNAGDKNPLKRKHPAVFPDQIPVDFIDCFCPPKGIVLDPFVGSGSTLVAAKKLGRNYIGIDISQEYCDLTEERLKKDIPNTLFK
ncbi:MAG: transcriptional repressor LexA [Candidatus Nomurabacteria bacterium]|nr:MAG: transcriptional repressor LexA [Candidatus Nomurabacteria bacterium]